MALFDASGIPHCTIDFPLEISPEEIACASSPVNTLLKSSFLLGTTFEVEATVNSIFDIAEEIAGVESCGLLSRIESDPRSWELSLGRHIDTHPPLDRLSFLIAPGPIVARFGKAISMDPEWGAWAKPICDSWSSRSLVVFPLHSDREITGAIVFGKRVSHPFTSLQVKLLWALSLQAETHLNHAEPKKNVYIYSFIDPLTHLYNRRYFDLILEKEVLRCRRNGGSFSQLMIDIDGFKKYNEKFKNMNGDIALQEFAGILSGSVREVDTVVRLGGDEFGILLLEGNTEGAKALAQRIIQRFHRHLLPGEAESRTERLSACVGFASFPADAFDAAELMKNASRALHQAKSKGTSQILSFQEATDTGRVKNVIPDMPVQKIYEAGRSVVNMDKFLEILLFTGMQGLSAGRGSIVVKNAEGDFTLCAAIGFSRHEEHLIASRGFRAGLITSWVVDHQLPLIVSKPEDFPFNLPIKKNGYQTESFLSIPLTYHGRTLGALHLTNRKDRQYFTIEDLKGFAPISSEIAAILAQGIEFRENIRTFSLSILTSLSDTLELRYPFLSGHSQRVRDLSTRIGEQMALSDIDLSALRHAAELHDVGIVGIPGNLLSKKHRLNERETEMVRKHPFLGSKMLEGVPGMDHTRRTILEHHENFDGSGYPYGLCGKDITLTARILSIAEFYDSAISSRPHRSAITPKEALQLVRNGSGTLFDPEVADLFAKTALSY